MTESADRMGGRNVLRVTRDARGVSLLEVTIVTLLAAVVMLALTGFYLNAQGTWMDASTQAVTQREASLVLGMIADSVHTANSAAGNPASSTLVLFDSQGSEICRFWLNPSDSLIHLGKGEVDRGPVEFSRVNQFELAWTATRVKIVNLELRSASGHPVRMSTLAAFYNR